ncbi:MAG: hypothetical protein HQ515_22015 [Phycisphaeraceae bacterium]|nr:hypothetical protein [Phycisphaeraceae bacterium]
MNTSITAIAENALSLGSVFIFVILFIMIHAALKHSQMFSGRIIGALSFCVTSLCMIAMGMIFVSPQTRGDPPAPTESPEMRVILPLYAALGVFLLLMFLLMSLGKLFGSGKTGKLVEEFFPPKVDFPNKKKTKPFIPVDLPMYLNKHRPSERDIVGDHPTQALRNTNCTKHTNTNPKPSHSKGIRHEK